MATALFAAALVTSATLVAPTLVGPVPTAGATTPTTVTDTFGFDNDTLQGFTVPPNVTSLTITATGGQGGWGGADSSGNPPPGGYQGQVSGTIPVTPGDYLTIGVGAGADEPYYTACTKGKDESSPADSYDAAPGINPLSQYDGGPGGAPGYNGCSGYGGAGGAATAVEVGSSPSSPTSLGTVVAGGGGGDGGSGQYVLVRGQIGLASYVPQNAPTPITYGIPAGCTTSCTSTPTIESPSPLPADATQGQAGIAVFTMCGGDTTGSNADQFFNTGAPNSEAGCDGGGGAGGGGGAAGGSAGNVQFGSGSSDEWYGQGGSPGENSTGGFSGLNSIDAYYADEDTGTCTGTDTFADPGTAFDGSVVITYSTGVPNAPTAVTGTVGNGDVALQWAAPSAAGVDPISDYVIQYSSNGGTTWTTDDTGSTSTSATVSGLTNGTGYIFEVEAVNSVGDGPFSSPSGTLTPSGPPGAPTITSISPEDGALQVNFSAPTTSTPINGYQYQLDGTGPWLASAATSSPLTISGLTDGTSYSVEIEAINDVGTGSASNSMSQTPVAVPGAPTITSTQVGPGTASIAFTPGSDGGSTLTGYRYSTDGGTSWSSTSSTDSPLSLTGLANGTTYPFELEAVDVSGDGAPATASLTTPSVPAAPVISSIVPQNQALDVEFTTPADGGSPITDYEWSTDNGTSWFSESAAGTPCQDTGGSSETCEISALSTDGATALTNGTAYPVELLAVNAVGDGSASAAQSGTPYTTPGAPTITTDAGGMVPADQTLTVSFTAPASDGGSPVTAYQYSTDSGATWQDRTDGQTTSTTMTISALSSDGMTPLTNGTTYAVEIRAVNAAGDGPASAVAAGIPATDPDAPSITSVTSEDGALGVDFTPGSNGGSAITSYEYSVDGGAWTPTGSLSPSFTVGGLDNGTSYSITVEAVNAIADSPVSGAESGTPATVPDQPSVTATSRGDGTISVSYSEASDGGSAVVSYEYSTDGGTTWSTAASDAGPLVITTLSTDGTTPIANGTDYPVEIRAVNAVGDSLSSSPVEVGPASAPDAPTLTLVPADGALTVEATLGGDGGSPVTGMDYSLDGGAFVPTGTTNATFTVPDLVNGTSYSVAVRADNAIGDGTPSAPASATPVAVPGAPTDVVAVSDSGSADVTWGAPGSDGGSAITGYTATAYTSSAGTTTAGTACTTTTTLACSVTGLTNGTTYYIGVVATNVAGPSPRSNPLQSVSPIARPGAPTLTAISTGDSFVAVTFTAGSAGGDPITSYQYTLDGGTTWSAASGTASPLTIDGLTDGTSYTVSLRAVSAAGPGAASNTKTDTPYTYPDTVDSSTVFANAENGQIAVSWTVPGDGGSAITEAQATAFNSLTYGTQEGTTCTATTQLAFGDTASCTVTGLTNGTTYYISIQSENAAGWSGRSSPRVPGTPSIDPGAVSNVTGVPGDGRVSLSWTAGSTGGSSITNYTIWYSSGGAYTQFNNGTSTATSATVTGLTNGTNYTFKVYAVNSGGTGPASAPSAGVTPEGPDITSSVLGGGDIDVAYAVTPTVSGGTGPFAWSVDDGSLPAGLSLDASTGAITGTPTSDGSSTFNLVVTDGVGGVGTQAEWVTIASAPGITSPALSDGEVGVAYTATPTVSGGTGPNAWSVDDGSLPAGLSLGASTGAITGTPTASGTSTFQLVVTDGAGGTATQAESVTVVAAPAFTTPPIGAGDVGVAYSATSTVSGGTGPYTWSVVDGSLPAGLSLDTNTGAITGTPTATGTFTFDLVVTDSLANWSAQPESVNVASAVAITSSALSGGEVGVAYDITPSVSGGSGSDTWSVADGTLPAGLSLDVSTGEVVGTPTVPGTSTFDLVVTDGLGGTFSQPESVTVDAAADITSPPLTGGEVGVAYDILPTATGGTGSFTWSVANGSLPDGLTLDPGTGEVTGIPTDGGTAVFDLEATDGLGGTASQPESVTVAAALAITSSALSGSEIGVAYDSLPTVSGGAGPYAWSVADGTLPAGLTLDAATGEITGTPTADGTQTFDLVVTDSMGGTSSQSESVTVVAGPAITSNALVGGEVGVAYDAIPTVSGGTGPDTWSVTDGSLPDGLALDSNSGKVSGTPTTSGESTFDLVVTDSLGQAYSQDESVTVAAEPSITSVALGAGEVGAAYEFLPTAAGGTGSSIWSVANGSLPDGLALDAATGEISGTPTTPGTSTFELVVTDSLDESGTQDESVTIADAPAVTSPSLDGGELVVPYDTTPVVSGGTGPFTWSVADGTLPAGLTLDASTGAVTGIPTAVGTSSFDLVVTDLFGNVARQSESVTVTPDPGFTSAALGGGEVGAPYDAAPVVSGGTGPYTWSVSDGTLPAGLTLDVSTGAITGTPTASGTSTFHLVVTDSLEQTATQDESVVIAAAPLAAGEGTVTGDVGVSVSQQLTVTGGTAPYSWSVSTGSLPGGVVLSPSGSVLGTPTQSGTFVVTVSVTDADKRSSVETLTVVVLPTNLNSRRMAVTPDGTGYWVASSDGDVTAFGTAGHYGTLAGKRLTAPVDGMAATSDGNGYWLVGSDGGVFSFGNAGFYGSEGNHHLNKPVVGMAATSDGNGYWLIAEDGGVFAFGDARYFGSEGNRHLNAPIVGMAATPDGKGYWLVAADGGVFAFGDARYFGSEGNRHLNAPIVGMAATPDGKGYWLVAADGGVFVFGDARYFGSEAGHDLAAPIDGIEAEQNGEGYWLVGADNGVFAFGSAPFMGADPNS
ncbi:MAG: putative Ig domain-containing protein [Acidimicrobiales bacterium]